MARASLVQRLAARGLDVLCGEVTSPAYDAIHRRRILFVGGEYWLVHDSLEGSQPHRYVLRFHLAPGAAGRPGVTRVGARETRAAGLGLLVAPPWPVAIEEGWVSASYGFKDPAPIVEATAEDVERADFFSLLIPLGDAAPMPAFEITRQALDGDEVIVADISFATPSGMRRDRVVWTASGQAAALPEIGTARAAAVLDADARERTQVVIPEPVDVYADCGSGRIAVPGVAV
jgi:hypothetical protein